MREVSTNPPFAIDEDRFRLELNLTIKDADDSEAFRQAMKYHAAVRKFMTTAAQKFGVPKDKANGCNCSGP